MSFSEKDIDLIDGHIKGELNSTQKQLFEKKLREDKNFAELLDTMKLAKEAIRRKALKKDFQELQLLEKSLPGIQLEKNRKINKIGSSRPSIKKWMVAAGFLLLLLAGGNYFWNSGSSPAEIFEQEFKVYSNLDNERLRGVRDPNEKIEQDDLKEEAYRLYESGDFENAIPVFQKLSAKTKEPKDDFYLGVAYLANDNSTQAIQTLQFFKDKESTYAVRANWYLALAYLKANKIKEAKKALNEIKNTTDAGSYKEKASRVLEQL